MIVEPVHRCPLCGGGDLRATEAEILLCRCECCGFLFRNPRPTRAEIAEYYSQKGQYIEWLRNEAGRDRLWRRRLRMMIRYGRHGRLLDVGAGIGQFLNLARNRYEVEGTEVSRRAVEIAKDKYGLRIHRGALEDIDFSDRRFEVITLFHVLEHVHDPAAMLSRCSELLSADGIVVIAIPNEIRGWKRPIKMLLARSGRGSPDYSKLYGLPKIQLDIPGEEIHLSHFTISTIRKLVSLCGLRVVDEDLDPCHASTGAKQLMHELAFRVCKLMYHLGGLHLGEAIWIAAEKLTSEYPGTCMRPRVSAKPPSR